MCNRVRGGRVAFHTAARLDEAARGCRVMKTPVHRTGGAPRLSRLEQNNADARKNEAVLEITGHSAAAAKLHQRMTLLTTPFYFTPP